MLNTLTFSINNVVHQKTIDKKKHDTINNLLYIINRIFKL